MAAEQSNTQDQHIKPELCISPEDYMKDRVVYKMGRYTDKSQRNRFWYLLTSVITIICSASVPVLIHQGAPVIYPTVLSLVVTIMVSFEKLFHFREHWHNYDAVAALLRRHQLQYQTGSGDYKEKAEKPEDTFRLFVSKIEEGIKEERADTIDMRTSGGE